MEISVRSYLTAGTAAVVGAAAIGISPALPAPDLRAVALPAPVVAEIALTGTSIPWETIAAVVKALSSGGSLQAGITSLITSIGTEFAKEALPIVTAAAGDVIKFAAVALVDLLGEGNVQIDIQKVIEAATAAIAAGNIGDAFQAVTSGLSASLGQIGKVLFTPEFQDFVMTKVGTVLGALPEILRSAVEKVVGLDIKPLIDMLSGLISKIIPGVTPPAAALAAPRALAAAAAPVAVAESVAVISPAPVDVPAAPEAEAAPASPAEDSAKATAEATPSAEAAPEATPAVEAAPEVTPVSEVPVVTEVPAEDVVPVTNSSAAAPAASDAGDAPAAPTRAAKQGSRHSAAKSADSGARG